MKEHQGILSICSVQFLNRLGRRKDMRDDLAEILFQSFLQGALVSSSGMGRDVYSLMLSIQHFLFLPWRRPSSSDGFGEAVVACDMPELGKFPSLDSYQERFLWTHKEVDLDLHPVVGLVL